MPKLIHIPTLAKIVDNSKTSATFVVEPIHSGYGMTLGNSLRRVLLSSIGGAAITSFRIDGVAHEFSTIPGIVEDVVEIMQNLKNIRFKVFSDEPQTLKIEKKGAGEVTAADIKNNADTEVVNPKCHIATIDSAKGNFSAEIVVESGFGYRIVDETSNKQSTDMILLDAIFSPVLRVRYKVENTRVGQMTDLDRLLLTIETDGSLTPRDAFEESSAILVNQYQALAGQTKVEPGLPLTAGVESVTDKATEASNENAILNTSIEDLNLSARTTNALVNNDIQTLKDLFSLSDSELRDLKGFGSKALDEVKEKMAELEL